MAWKRKWIGMMLTAILTFMSFFSLQSSAWAQEAKIKPLWAHQNFNTRQINVKLAQDSLKMLFGNEGIPDVKGIDKKLWKKVNFPKAKGMKAARQESSEWYNLTLPEDVDLEEVLAVLVEDLQVLYVEPDPIRYLLEGESDPYLDRQWHLDAIDSPEAWSYMESKGLPEGGSSQVVVAVIDSGIRATHEDLVDSLWINPGEIPENGIDDDGNGYTDDVYGFNTYDNNNNINDVNGHGTHVAGIIAAQKDNGKGVSGVALSVKIMPIRASSSAGTLTSVSTVRALNYAVENGAHVVNMSFGGNVSSTMEREAYLAAQESVVLIAAAGNESRATSSALSYPAAYPGVLGVMSTDATPQSDGDYVSAFSNFDNLPEDGIGYEVMAPGAAIFSTVYNSNSSYDFKSGTSMATPVVSGMAAMVRSIQPDELELTPQQLQSRILRTGIRKQGITYGGTTFFYPYVNLEKALKQPDTLVLSHSQVLLESLGDTMQLSVYALPQFTDNAVLWTSEHPDLVTVDEQGLIRGVGTGVTTIHAQSIYGDAVGSCQVVVPDATGDWVSSIVWKTLPSKVTYIVGEPFDPSGGVLLVNMASGNQEEMVLTAEMVQGFDTNTPGSQQLTVTWMGATTHFSVVVLQRTFSVQFSVSGRGGTLGASLNDTAIQSDSLATEGQTVFFTAVPNDRYQVYQWMVNGVAQPGVERTLQVPITQTTTVSVSFYLEGDLNQDDTANITDLVTLRRTLAGLTSLSGKSLLAADLNRDGSVNITDLVILRRRLAGLE